MMEFKEILERYENDVDYADRMLDPKSLSFFKKSDEYWRGYKRASYEWFQYMKLVCSFKPQTETMSEEESKKNIYIDEYNNYYFPYGWLIYRGEKVPVYYDDYGQQEFIVYKTQSFYSGAYNLSALFDFCSFIDTIKDKIE